LSWADVPSPFNATVAQRGSQFVLGLGLGLLRGGQRLSIDPSITGSDNDQLGATRYPFQHHVYKDPKTGYYWIFYHDPNSRYGLVYKYSTDGVNWGPSNDMPSGWPAWGSDNRISSPGIYFSGETVAVVTGYSVIANGVPLGVNVNDYVYLVVGTFSGTQILWGTVNPVFNPNGPEALFICNSPSSNILCWMSVGSRYASVDIDTQGRIWISANFYEYSTPHNNQYLSQQCYDFQSGSFQGFYSSGYIDVMMIDKSGNINEEFPAGSSQDTGACYRYDLEHWRSVMLTTDFQGTSGTTVLFQGTRHILSSGPPYSIVGLQENLTAQWSNGASFQPYWVVEPNVPDNDWFSAVSDVEDGTHFGIDIVYRGTNGNITYAHRSAFGTGWTYEKNIFNGVLSTNPVITTDYSTGDVYAFGMTSPIDSYANNGCDHTTNSCVVTLSTSKANDIIVVYTYETLDLKPSCTFSVSDTAGLTWTARNANPVYGNNNRDELQEFYAKTSSVLSSDIITESISGCGGSGTFGGEYNGLEVFAVSGANFNSPFDSNSGLPSTNSGSSGTPSLTTSTNSPNDLIIAGAQMNGPTDGAGGFSLITGGPNEPVQYEPVSSAVTNLAVQFSGNSGNWEEIADAVQLTTPSSIVMRTRTLADNFADHSILYPVIQRNNVTLLESSFSVASATNSSYLSLIWTEPTSTSSYNVMFASLPVQTVWSPYGLSRDPWDGSGISPYGQYFQNLGEYVSPSTGMLTIRQTDLSVPGRGLNLEVTRVYTEPYSFLNSIPYNYESYPWAPMGDGWQLNLPWMLSTSNPTYIHLWNGEGYRIPLNFWSGSTATFENHQGDNFRLVRYVNSTIILFDKSGTAYNFGTSPNHGLVSIRDSTGNNTIAINYSNNLISCMSDTVQRAFTFSYSGGLLQKISQVNGSCTSPGSAIRSITYGNNGQSLTSVTDPANRATSYSYSSNPFLLSQITYPTQWYDSYTYTGFTLGTQATSYRVTLQQTMAGPSTTIRQSAYSYVQSPGDQVIGNTITNYNGTQIVGYTKYAFSFVVDVKNTTDASGNLLNGDKQAFSVGGQISKDISFVTDGTGLTGPGHIGSYTNYFTYDLWGNQIYTRRVINPSSNWNHESFNSYYNNGEPPGFYAFQDSFSQLKGNAPDNSWNDTNGYWLVNSGVYNGTETPGKQESMFAWYNIGRGDISIQARVYIARKVNATDQRIGLIAHYPGTGLNKWALVLHNSTSGFKLSLLDEYVTWVVENPCSAPVYNTWYTFNFTTRGNTATGWASAPGISTCTVSGAFPSDSVGTATGFGLYAGGYSALFDDVLVTTVSPYITGNGFSNSFIQNGAPGPIGYNTWLATTKPPGLGWNITRNWLPASAWSQAYASQNYGGSPWLNQVNHWPDNSAQWIWWDTNANISASSDPVWFRRVFSLPTATNINVTITSDNTYVVYVDGVKLGQQLSIGTAWQTPHWNTTSLGAGYHVIAVIATNPDGVDAAGLLVSVTSVSTRQVLLRSDATAGPLIGAQAGSAQLQNGTFTVPFESYIGYTMWGGQNKTITRNDPSPLFVDGSSQAFCSHSTNSCQTGLSTSRPNDIIIVYALEQLDLQTSCTFSVSDTAALSWTNRGGVSGRNDGTTGSNRDQIQEFWAKSASPLASDTITESISGCASTLYGGEYNGLLVIAISGANLSSPFDPSTSQPATGSGYSNTPSATISTSNSPDIIIGVGQQSSYGILTPESGFAIVTFTGGCCQTTEYKVTNQPLTNFAVTFGDNTVWYWEEMADAIQPATTGQSTQWLATTTRYDVYGNLMNLTDARGNVTSFQYSSKYQNAYMTSKTQKALPGSTSMISSYGYNFTTGAMLWTQQPNGYSSKNYNTTYTYDNIGRITRVNYPVVSQVYNLTLQGYDYDGGGEETLTLNGHTLASLPTVNSPQNAGIYVAFTVTMTPLIVVGSNTLTFTHAPWDCGVVDNTKNVQVTANGRVIFSDPTVRPLSCTQSITYLFTVSPDFTIYTYNDASNYVNMTNENGWTTKQIYDGLGRLVSTQRFLGGTLYSTATSTYNWMSKATTSVDPLGNKDTYQYDTLGRIVMTIKPDGNSTIEFYNDTGSWARLTDEYGNYRCNISDRLGRLISVIEQANSKCQTGIVTNYYYDEVGNLFRVTNAKRVSTFYNYDNLGRLSQTTYPDGTTETYSYDNSGNVVKKVDRNSVKTLLSYDSMNRLLTVTYCGSPVTSRSYTYDSDSNLLSLQNQNSTQTNVYDMRNRILNETYSVNPTTRQVIDLGCNGSGGTSTTSGGVSKTYTVATTYQGELVYTIAYPTITQTNPDITVKYGYDGLGRVLNVTNLSTASYLARLTYNKADQVVGIQYGNGLVANYTYDRLLHVSNVTLQNTGTHTTMMTLAYLYNKTGTVSSVVGQVNSKSVNEQYKYDPLQRLINSTVTSNSGRTTLWYQYDSVGNIVAQSINGTVTTYNYNSANNELVSSSSSGVSTVYAYDKNGNLLNKNVTTTGTTRWYYTWNAAGDLLKVTNSTGRALYAYDGAGRRVEAIEGGSTWFFAYTDSEILYKNLLNTDNYEYIFVSGFRIAMFIDRTAGYYYHADALGSVRMITYNDASIVYTNGYLPFGGTNGTPTGSFKSSASDKFNGKPYSTATGLYYYFHRWYDPTTGRFISPDPKSGSLSSPQSLNLYIYVLDAPTGLTDPTGLDSCGWLNPLGCVVNAGQAAGNWWNGLDPEWKTAIIAGVGTALIIATAGVATPVVVGALIGAGVSAGLYTASHNPADPNSGFSLKGLIAATLTGSFFGALGGAAGPAGGSLSKVFTGTTQFAKLGSYGFLIGGSLGFDTIRGADPTTTGVDATLAVVTFGIGDHFWPTPSVRTLSQLKAQSPSWSGLAAAFRMPPPSAPTAGALSRAAIWGSLYPGLAGDSVQDFLINPLRHILGF